jgi:ABC-type Co2+ transport system permease subunit
MSSKIEEPQSSSVEVFVALSIAAAVISFLSGFQYTPSYGPLVFIVGGGVAAVAFGLCAIALAVENLANHRDGKDRNSQGTS